MDGNGQAHEDAPFCECGRGRLKIQPASSKAHHPGRLYYKCSTKTGSCGFWKWIDLYESARSGGFATTSRKPNVQDSSMLSDMSASSIATEPVINRRIATNRLKPEDHLCIMYLFMATVLVLLGFIIAKIL